MESRHRQPVAVEATIRNAIRRHQLDCIGISTLSGENYEAVAYPASHHPIVHQWRKTAAASRPSRLTAELEEIIVMSLELIATGDDKRIEGAVAQLVEPFDASTG